MVSLQLELTNVFPIRKIVNSASTAVFELARELRKSGSDLLVEEELADIFDRGRINTELEENFKKAVLSIGDVVGIRQNDGSAKTGIMLDSRPGPSLQRAIKDPTRRYLSTLIQLSLLNWMHGRASLASAMCECMNARFQAGAPGSTPNSGVEAVQSMLDACSSQTGAFNWNGYVQTIETKIAETHTDFRHLRELMALSPKLLLACMDYLYIVQRLPEDRRMVVEGTMGIVTLIIWAHYCLDLSLLISGVPGGNISFGDCSSKPPQVIVTWTQSVDQLDVSLLDKDMKLILTPDDTPQHSIEACERLPLEDFGTTTLWREFNTGTSLERTSPEFIDAVTYVMALALTSVRTLVRVRHGDDHHVALDISRWQIYDVGRVIFATVEYKNSVIEKIVDKTAENALMKEVAVPMALKTFFEEQLQRAGVGPERLLPVQLRLMRLAVLVISLSAVRGISACREMPIFADIGPLQTVGFTERVTSTQDRGPHLVQSTDLFFSVAQVLLGGYRLNTEELARKPNVFMMSEFGWTLYLSSVAATDPADAIPDQLFLKRGVPTNESTQERKLWVRDMTDIGGDGMIPARKITDRGQVCEPRCVEQVVKRVEYYSTSKDEFRLSIRHCMELHTSSMANVDCRYDIYRSYRAFHDGLWESTLVPSCEHDQVRVQTDFIELLPDMAAGTALDWSNEGQEGDIEEDERLCVALVKGNPHSRWLAVAEAGFGMPRNVALRGPTTCATCALKWAAERPGKWLIIV